MVELLGGWQWRQEREWERAAWMVAYLLRPWSKHPIKPADLLGRVTDPETPDQPETFAQWLAQAQAKQQALKGAVDGSH